MAETKNQTTQEKPVRTDAKSSADSQTEKPLIADPNKDMSTLLKGNDGKKDGNLTRLNG